LASGVPFLLAVPRAPVRGVVVLLHSLEADARTILDLVGDDLASEGLASAAFDLPLHGERARPGEPFLAPDDPTRFAENALPAVGDILALTAVLQHCSDAVGLPSGVPTDRIGLLGYSIGASLGLLALAADPALDPAVLLAPAGDIQRWQALLLARRIDLIDKVCIGPGRDGTCTDDVTCGPGAVCDRHPGLFLIAPAVLPPSRLLIGDAEPLGTTALLRPPIDARPILIQYATDDWIVFPSQARLVADALALPLVPAGRDLPSRALRAWPGGHEFILDDAVRAEAVRFLARHLSSTR
jgi:pimeloyl-ACP methyl ester carboxylesterase